MQIKDIIPWAHRDHSFDADTHHENPIATLQRDINKVLDNFRSRFGDLH